MFTAPGGGKSNKKRKGGANGNNRGGPGGGLPGCGGCGGVGPIQPKNAVVTLNELKPDLEYVTVEQRGPVHLPTFVIEVTVNGEKFRGEGR